MLMLIIVLTEAYSLNKMCHWTSKCTIRIAGPGKFKLALHNIITNVIFLVCFLGYVYIFGPLNSMQKLNIEENLNTGCLH